VRVCPRLSVCLSLSVCVLLLPLDQPLQLGPHEASSAGGLQQGEDLGQSLVPHLLQDAQQPHLEEHLQQEHMMMMMMMMNQWDLVP